MYRILNLRILWGGYIEQEGELDLAMDVLEKAAADEPDDAAILYHLGVIYKEKGMVNEAMEVLEAVLSIDSNFSQAEDAMRMLEQLN